MALQLVFSPARQKSHLRFPLSLFSPLGCIWTVFFLPLLSFFSFFSPLPFFSLRPHATMSWSEGAHLWPEKCSSSPPLASWPPAELASQLGGGHRGREAKCQRRVKKKTKKWLVWLFFFFFFLHLLQDCCTFSNILNSSDFGTQKRVFQHLRCNFPYYIYILCIKAHQDIPLHQMSSWRLGQLVSLRVQLKLFVGRSGWEVLPFAHKEIQYFIHAARCTACRFHCQLPSSDIALNK